MSIDDEMELELTQYSPAVFFKLAQHAKERNLLKSWERSLVFNIGKYIKNEWKISRKMETQAYRIIKAAQDCGLWQQVEEELDREEDYGERSKFDTQKKFTESIRSPFTNEWSPARQYLTQAFKLEGEGADPKAVQDQINKAREVDVTYTDTCLGLWAIIKERQSKSKHD